MESDAQGIPPPVMHGRHCGACGYDLRGIDSPRCPECGTPAPYSIAVYDHQQFHLARAALENARLLVSFVNPGGAISTLGLMFSSWPVAGWLMVDSTQLERVEELFDELGIVSSINTRPIVDRTEPFCPSCQHELDPQGPEECSTCGAAFHWVQIDESDL